MLHAIENENICIEQKSFYDRYLQDIQTYFILSTSINIHAKPCLLTNCVTIIIFCTSL